jgi:glycosyltransferase involved in cell wall biosynthesis
VGVDGRSLRPGGQRGIARYTRRLLGALASGFPEDRFLVLTPGAASGAARELEGPNLELIETRLGGRALFASAALTGRPRLDRMVGGCDVLWAPAPAPLAASRAVPLVVTVHDLSFEHRARDFTPYERAWHAVARPRRLAARAARVIADAEAVRRDLVAEWGLAPERVVTVHAGPGIDATAGEGGPATSGPEAAALPAGLREPYLLVVGALEPRKLPGVVLEAHRRAQAAGLEAELVFAGEGPMGPELAERGARLLGYVSDEQLDALYRGALGLVCASREEGFGFTPIEALSRGTPAIVADLPVFAETLGDGALRVPPGDVDALAQALLRLEREPQLRKRIVATGATAAAALSWETAAARTHEVLAAAAARRP